MAVFVSRNELLDRLLVILSSNYSKLVPDGDLWRDVRSQGVVSLRDIEEAVVQKPE